MRLVRRVLSTVAVVLLVANAVLGASAAARAQTTGVTLQLLRQSPWCSLYKRSTLDLELLATNSGTTSLDTLRVAVSFGPHLATQTDFRAMLEAAPTTVIATAEKDVRGEIAPGAFRTIAMSIDLSAISAIDQVDPQTYPATVQLLAGGTVVASLVTPVIYLTREPVAPLLAATWLELPASVAFDPSGQLTDPSFPAALAPGGALRAPLSALDAVSSGRRARGSFDLVVDPLAVTQARSVAGGFRTPDGTEVSASDQVAKQAARFTQILSQVSSNVARIETVAQPYASPLLPSMLAGGLDTELAAERAAGSIVITSLGGAPAFTVARPTQGAIDATSLDYLTRVGTTVVLANADTVDRSAVQTTTAPAPTVPVTTGSGSTTMVLPDPDVEALFVRSDLLTDPVRAAQMVLGELAVIWKQAPVPEPPTVRGIAIAPPATLPTSMWRPLLERLGGAPFLNPIKATSLVDDVTPSVPNPELPLASPSTIRFSQAYADEIRHESDRVAAYGSMVDLPDAATELRRTLFLATTPDATIDSRIGQPWVDSVHATTQRAFDAVTPSVSDLITLTSREGVIPLAMGDPGGMTLRATIELQGSHFTFPDGNIVPVEISEPGTVKHVRVVATSSGQNQIQIVTKAPDGRPIADVITISVRSTAANTIALVVTLAAAVGLLLLYARRWFRRRRMNPTASTA